MLKNVYPHPGFLLEASSTGFRMSPEFAKCSHGDKLPPVETPPHLDFDDQF